MKNTLVIFLMALNFWSLEVIAQNDFDTKAGNDFKIKLTTEAGQTDNFLYSNDNELNTSYLLISPNVYLQTQIERHLFRFNSNFEHVKYQEFSQDNHSNYTLSPGYHYKFSQNQSIVIKSLLSNSYENRGTGLSLGDADSIKKGDTKKSKLLAINYLYGSKDSVAKINVEVGFTEQYYSTRREITRSQDRESFYVNPSFDYLISDQSYFALDVLYEQLKSTHNPLQDKEKYAGLIGTKWHYSDITQFSLLFGYQEIRFSESTFKKDDAFKWRAELNWRPMGSTKITLGSERDFEEANRLTTSYRIVDSYDLAISKSFTEYFGFDAVIGLKSEDVIFEQGIDQEEYLHSKIKLNYQRNNWFSVFIEYDFKDLDADDSQLSYQRNGISLGFNVNI